MPDIRAENNSSHVVNPVSIADVHATILKALSIDYEELETPLGGWQFLKVLRLLN